VTVDIGLVVEVCDFLRFLALLQTFSRTMVLTKCKALALPHPEIIGGTKKFGQSLDMSTLPLLKNF